MWVRRCINPSPRSGSKVEERRRVLRGKKVRVVVFFCEKWEIKGMRGDYDSTHLT